MFNIYYSNDLDVQKNILLSLMEEKLEDPFQSETILVQSPGMAQWLQWKIAEQKGIAANINFPMPASFIWRQYVDNLPDVDSQTAFHKASMTWRLMRLIPTYLTQAEFEPLRHYVSSSTQTEQQKLYQVAHKIADLFDQYLVYRPDWIRHWENEEELEVIKQFRLLSTSKNKAIFKQLEKDITWQAILWRALVMDIQKQSESNFPLHRANLQSQFLQFLQKNQLVNLPDRIFVFGISALPKGYLDTLYAISQHCTVHLFFTNGCREYWGDLIDTRFMQNLAQLQRVSYSFNRVKPVLLPEFESAFEVSYENEKLLEGHPLLSSWGKLGRDFLYLLTELEQNDNVRSIEAYTELSSPTLLSQVQARILHLDGHTRLNLTENDRTLTFHSCHSAMREVEVLQDYLLHLLQLNPELTPKDIVVMVADIDKYTPYIQAVFGQQYNESNAAIPFSISDNKLSESDVLIANFIHLLNIKESQFSAEEILALLDVPAIRAKFNIELSDLEQIRHWVINSGIRFGLEKHNGEQQKNYNAWQAGLERMILGYAMREENGLWQDNLGFDSSYGLQGQLTGRLAEFVDVLVQWTHCIQIAQPIEQWHKSLNNLLSDFFERNESNISTLLYIQQQIDQLVEEVQKTDFEEAISIDVIAEALGTLLENDPNTMRFLAGKVNFCTLLPMRSIPFKVVCLLGMNDGEYPRQQTPNSFDLMQYDRRKGDRFRRDDDCYLFLEALLSAQDYFYVSFIGRSIIDNQEKQPSVLVSQLLDYLADKLFSENEVDWKSVLISQHPMTAFSPKNFKSPNPSFAKQWLPLAIPQKNRVDEDFIQPISHSLIEEELEINLSDLIAFVQHPVEFFFKRRLGVHFAQQEDVIAESENFTLDGLTKYCINEALLNCPDQEIESFFTQLKVKGILPRGEFAQIYEYQHEEDIRLLKDTIAIYLSQEQQVLPFDIVLSINQRKVRLIGNIDRIYDNHRVTWHVGSIKDKHLVEAWIYYLAQCVVAEDKEVVPPICYGKDEQKSFKPLIANASMSISAQALNQLQIYIESYIKGYQQLQLVPTVNLKSYLKLINDESAVDFEKVLTMLRKIGEGDEYVQGDVYWKRVLTQQRFSDTFLKEINQRTQDWFQCMLEHLV
ncbi:exodeoxyribonuclease V subunit gamma [Pasteurella canis]|uniref:exodeoxyribonuclease V subunit gamma n=1 Tax=Pasteurella canis TaxID=753 RepID=UPI001D1250ED|nr:exodeoxyribonuclease V subunit gamma [Pasteurella canis]UDW84044.1 exodeoxyribonuclease V subunit gamma [Pasteurella canis]